MSAPPSGQVLSRPPPRGSFGAALSRQLPPGGSYPGDSFRAVLRATPSRIRLTRVLCTPYRPERRGSRPDTRPRRGRTGPGAGRWIPLTRGVGGTTRGRRPASRRLQRHRHALRLRVVVQGFDALLAAVAALLVAAERRLHPAGPPGVDEDLARLDLRGDAQRPADVAGPDAGHQAVRASRWRWRSPRPPCRTGSRRGRGRRPPPARSAWRCPRRCRRSGGRRSRGVSVAAAAAAPPVTGTAPSASATSRYERTVPYWPSLMTGPMVSPESVRARPSPRSWPRARRGSRAGRAGASRPSRPGRRST